ncbi:MAG: rod shape-determining protein RodA [Butyrivibrio sp.]|nr:rod shape-determining protein RodA [Butyrivibrio sp.]
MFKNFRFRLKYVNFRLILWVFAITAIGIAVIGSAAPGAGYQNRQIMGLAIGAVLMVLLMLIDYNWILKFHWLIYLACIVLLFLVLKMGEHHKGATRWIEIANVTFQPSEFAKIMLILFWSWLLGKNPNMVKKWKYFFISVLLTAVPLLLIAEEPDLSTTILVAVLFVIQLFIAGFSYKKFAIILGALIPVAAAVIIYINVVPPSSGKNLLLHPYQYKRIMDFFNPEENDDGRLQQENAVMAIGSGGLTGKGLYNESANSVKNGNYIPEPQTDFIFAIIGEELGFVGCAAVLLLLLLIAAECVVTGARAPDMQGRLICFGVASIVIFQTFINIGVVTAILPNTGIPLPFVSYGLSSLVAMYAGIGLVLNVRFRKKALLEEEKKDEHRLNSA